MRFYVYTTFTLNNRERYWTGGLTATGIPSTSADLMDAASWPTARAAYESAGEQVPESRLLLSYRVGRRPTPVNLRAAA